MNTTLMRGDFFYINKLSYSPRFFRTPLSVPLVNGKWYWDAVQIPYFRLFGKPGIERNDVIVFNFPLAIEHPVDHREQFVKRCVALPGDSVALINSKTFVNGKASGDSAFTIFNYMIQTKKGTNDTVFFKKFGLEVDSKISDEGHYSFGISDQLARKMAAEPEILVLTKQTENKDDPDETVFPYNENIPWNIDHFGYLRVPKEGDVLAIDTSNFCFYEKIISVYEKNKTEIKNGKIFINDDSTGKYTVKMNYYFVLGDNRHDSRDSRHWGFLPEDHIMGKASFILFSYDKQNSHFRKGRWFKGVD
jgi:signal peptidase I